jgi:hypothetical protein
VNFGIAFLGDQVNEGAHLRDANRISAFVAALDAYRFLFRNFKRGFSLLLLPITAAGFVLYLTLNRYLAGLRSFLQMPDTRVATLTLGMLAAGLFLSLFCYAIAVSAVSDLALGKPLKDSWLHFRVRRQEWRIYAAYLRLLMLLSMVFVTVFFGAIYIEPLHLIPPLFAAWVLTFLCVLAVIFLFARIGFLVAPIVSTSEGMILRKAYQSSVGDLGRNCLLLALFLVPGILLLTAAGYVFRMQGYAVPVVGTLPLADAARSMREMLGPCLVVINLSLSVTIFLFTVGAISVYRRRLFEHNAPVRASAFGPSLGRPLPAEGPPK